MRAIWLERYGAPEVLIERETDSPEVAPDEIRIEVEASGVNFADLLQRLGLYGTAPELPYVPGFEVAGTIEEAGRDVANLKVGDRVVGLSKTGGYATELTLPAGSVQVIPDSLSFSQAAALPVNYLTAWFCLFPIGNLQPSDRLLIHGGTGGVGIAAIQLAGEQPVTIFATVGSQRKVDFLTNLGLAHVINYNTTHFVDYVREQTKGEGVEVILDPVGGKTLRNSYELLAPLGRLVSYGLSAAVASKRRNRLRTLAAWWKTPRFSPLDMIGRNAGVFGFHLALLGSKERMVPKAMGSIIRRTSAGTLEPVISAEFPLSAEGAIEAHHYLHDRKNIGKVLLVRHSS